MAASDLWKNLWGTLNSFFQIGGTAGIRWKNNSSVMEARDSDDTDFVPVRGLAATQDDEFVTWKQLLTARGTAIISRQADCTAALPVNTTTRGLVVVSTAGTGAAIGDLLFDNGLNTGNMTIIAAIEGQMILVTDSLTGGTVSFDPDTFYAWDADNLEWRGQVSESSGAVRCLRMAIDNTAAQASTHKIPANARILRCDVEIVTPYTAGATIMVGWTGDTDGIISTTAGHDPCTAGFYSFEQDTAFKATLDTLLVTTSAPVAGAGFVCVWFVIPLN